MSTVDDAQANPYAVTTTEIVLPTDPESVSNEPLLAVDVRTNVGGIVAGLIKFFQGLLE